MNSIKPDIWYVKTHDSLKLNGIPSFNLDSRNMLGDLVPG